MLKYFISVSIPAVAAIGVLCAIPAHADEIPSPDGDVSSLGSFGNSSFGGSIGTQGFTSSLGGTTLTSSGFPTSRTTIIGPMGEYRAETDYGYRENSGIRSDSTFTSDMFDYQNHFHVAPDSGVSSEDVVAFGGVEYHSHGSFRVGSMSYTCSLNSCKMVN